MRRRKNSNRVTTQDAKFFSRVRFESTDCGDIISDYRDYGDVDTSRRVTWRYMAVLGVILGVFTTAASLVGDSIEVFHEHRVSQRTLATVMTIFLILSVPVTHGHGLRKYATFQFWQPLQGGAMFVFLQAFGWTIYALAICIALYTLYAGSATYFKYVGATGVVAQVCILTSLYYFSSPKLTPSPPTSTSTASSSSSSSFSSIDDVPEESGSQQQQQQRLSSSSSVAKVPVQQAPVSDALDASQRAQQAKSSWARRFEVLAVICSVISCMLAVVLETQELDEGSTVSLGTLSVTSILISVPFLHILAGPNRYEEYSLFQPFRGGISFVSLQALAWTLWAFACSTSVVHISVDSLDLWHKYYISHSMAGVAGVTANVLLLVSLRVFDRSMADTLCSLESEVDSDSPGYFKEPISRPRVFRAMCINILHDSSVLLLVTLFYCAPLLAIVSVVGHAGVLFYAEYGWLYVGLSFAVYATTFRPGHRVGATRMWQPFRQATRIWSCFEDYFNLRVVPEGNLSANENYLFAFHPHGLLPASAVFGTLGQKWKQHYSHVDVSVCGASLLFYIPLLRDLLSWCGCRDVTKSAIRSGLLEEKTSVLLIPGGQREMRESRPDKETMLLCVRHKGFVRMAIQTGKKLVPVLSFGEDQILSNVYVPGMQAYTLQRIGVALPVYIMGRWYSPIPNKVDVTIVVGDPLDIEQCDEPSAEMIDEVHERYYQRIRDMFDRHRVAAGFPDCELRFFTH